MTTDDAIVTTWGTVRLTKRDVEWSERTREDVQARMWRTHGEEIIGVPEVEPWNDLNINGLQKSQLWIEDHWWM
jgi:hypothetical protein